MDRKILGLLMAAGLLLLLYGCFHHGLVQHLAADASLITPGKSTRQDVRNYLGEPAEKLRREDSTELWIYYQVNKSLLRKTPYIGKNIGEEVYDVLRVIFSGDTVQSVTFRALPGQDFKAGEGAMPP
jgi:hypothetical protein